MKIEVVTGPFGAVVNHRVGVNDRHVAIGHIAGA